MGSNRSVVTLTLPLPLPRPQRGADISKSSLTAGATCTARCRLPAPAFASGPALRASIFLAFASRQPQTRNGEASAGRTAVDSLLQETSAGGECEFTAAGRRVDDPLELPLGHFSLSALSLCRVLPLGSGPEQRVPGAAGRAQSAGSLRWLASLVDSSEGASLASRPSCSFRLRFVSHALWEHPPREATRPLLSFLATLLEVPESQLASGELGAKGKVELEAPRVLEAAADLGSAQGEKKVPL